MTTDEKIAAYDQRISTYEIDVPIVKSILAVKPLNTDALKPFASKYFDGICTSAYLQCGCVYCEARRAIAKETA